MVKLKERVRKWRGWKVKLASLAVCFILLGYALPPIHEDAHAKVCLWDGGAATIESAAWGLGGQMNWIPGQIPPHTWLVYLAGGLGVFVFFMLLRIWFRRSTTLWDLNYELALLLWAMPSLFYAFAELTLYFGTTYTNLFYISSAVGFGLGVVIALILSFKRIEKWFTTEEEIIRVEEKKRIFEKITGILCYGALIGMVAPRLNAWIQDAACRALGGTCHIESVKWWALKGSMHFSELPSHYAWVIASAGIIVFLIFLGLWIWAYKSPTLWDTGMEFALAIWGVAELTLGGIRLYSYFYPQWPLPEPTLTFLPIGTAAIVGIGYIPKLVKWVSTKEIINRRLV